MIRNLILTFSQAHYHGRRADNHLRCRRFDEAIESHRKATAALEDVLKAITSGKIVESIRLQRDYHLKKIELIHLKRKQYEIYKTAVEHERLKNESIVDSHPFKDSTCDLQIAIYKTLEEADSLLAALKKKQKQNAVEEGAACEAIETESEKNNENVLDDLQSINHELHILIFNLMSKVDESNHDMESMRERLKGLDKDNKNASQRLPASKSSSKSSIKSDESGVERMSRRCSVTGDERKIVLPESSELPPLELPEFDYSTYDEQGQE